mgnify:CR=1 FL=1
MMQITFFIPPLLKTGRAHLAMFRFFRTFAVEFKTYRGVEQLVARQAHNLEVVRSSRASATFFKAQPHPHRVGLRCFYGPAPVSPPRGRPLKQGRTLSETRSDLNSTRSDFNFSKSDLVFYRRTAGAATGLQHNQHRPDTLLHPLCNNLCRTLHRKKERS